VISIEYDLPDKGNGSLITTLAKERNIENSSDRKYYEVLIDRKEIGIYFLTDDLIDAHLIEHFCGIFKCLGYRTEITIEN